MQLTIVVNIADEAPLSPERQQRYAEFLHDVADLAIFVHDIQVECGGAAASHPDYPIADWMEAVDRLETRLGYWEWVAHHISLDSADDDEDDDDLPS